MNYKLIVACVKPEYSDQTVDAAKENGATGATILPGRGTGMHEAKTFFGLTLEARTDVILFLVDAVLVPTLLDAISKASKFEEPGTGIAYVVDIDKAIGMESQTRQNLQQG